MTDIYIRKLKIGIKFIFMNHWGDLWLLPCVYMNVTYSMPTFVFQWWVFRMDIEIRRRFPDWFMKYVWSVINLDFLCRKKK